MPTGDQDGAGHGQSLREAKMERPRQTGNLLKRAPQPLNLPERCQSPPVEFLLVREEKKKRKKGDELTMPARTFGSEMSRSPNQSTLSVPRHSDRSWEPKTGPAILFLDFPIVWIPDTKPRHRTLPR